MRLVVKGGNICVQLNQYATVGNSIIFITLLAVGSPKTKAWRKEGGRKEVLRGGGRGGGKRFNKQNEM